MSVHSPVPRDCSDRKCDLPVGQEPSRHDGTDHVAHVRDAALQALPALPHVSPFFARRHAAIAA